MATFLLSVGSQSMAGELQITVTNQQPGGGFAFTPVWIGVHDGTFSTFSSGGTASSAVQAVAELGDVSGLVADFSGQGSQTVVGGSPFLPGATASTVLSVADPVIHQYLSYASMIVPSNDFFMGNADPTAFRLFDDGGNFLGPLTINVFGRNIWDAGTEVNDITFGAAFIAGVSALDHVAENRTIDLVFGGSADFTAYLNSIDGRTTAGGYDISHLITSNDLIATIQISAVPEPSTVTLLGIGVVGTALLARRSRGRGRG
jgi:hypothetical protein